MEILPVPPVLEHIQGSGQRSSVHFRVDDVQQNHYHDEKHDKTANDDDPNGRFRQNVHLTAA